VIVWRVFPLDGPAGGSQPGGALWFPRAFQGVGRHDNPERYGCLYVTLDPVAAVAEALAQFRGSGQLTDAMLMRGGRRLALCSLELESDGGALVDLDDPAVLVAERLRPSQVATRARERTQAQALRLHDARPDALGLRWWSTLEASWINVTLFDRAAGRLALDRFEPLTPSDANTLGAAMFLGLR
jgi:RES domain-containing protein